MASLAATMTLPRHQPHVHPAVSQLATVALLTAFLLAWLMGIVVVLAVLGGAA